ncbi:hypothetical protein LCGC14_1950450 [marine sediment metagenome]|uniref:Uncharacterized protein n=1 Tax=marine sediment metagenome TaxID=412755 RepID=A0A0F9IEM2_9ZZZZ
MKDFKVILVEAEELTYKGIHFNGITTSQHFLPENTLEEIKKIKPTLIKELVELEAEKVKNYQLKDSTKKKVLVVRKICPEIIRALGLIAGETMAILINSFPRKNNITNKYEFGVYSYKSIIVTEEPKEETTVADTKVEEKVEQEIIKTLKEFVEIKPISYPIQLVSGLFYSAILTDKSNKDTLVYIPIEDIIEIRRQNAKKAKS